MAMTRRAAKKGGIRRTLAVRCESWHEFAARYANDIGLGGIYIETDDPPELLASVEARILLPEGHEVKFDANVVHVPSAEEAKAEGRTKGVGLEFLNIDPVMKQQLWHLVEYAKWEAGAPGARSYAAALMQFAENQAASDDSETWRSLSPPPFEDDELEEPDEAEEPEQEADETEEEAAPEQRITVSAPSSYEADASRSAHPPLSAAETDRSVRPTSGRAIDAARKLAASLRTNQAAGTGGDRVAIAGGGGVATPAPAASRARISSPLPAGARSSKPPSAARNEKIDVAFKDIAYKRYDLAIRTLEEIIAQEPSNTKARIWLNVARARRAVQKGKRDEAVRFFQLVLELDERNHEAQKYVQGYEREERVKNVPFARYFTRKS